MVAHRGLSGIEKENTCSAFVAACNRATYFAVETDVHRPVDGQFVEDKQKEEFIRSQQHKLAKKSRARRSSADKK